MANNAAIFFGTLEQKHKEEVLRRVSEEAAARFDRYMKALELATGLKDLGPDERLQAYRSRGPEIWSLLQSKFTREYERQMQDWGRLESRAIRELKLPSTIGSRTSAAVSPFTMPGAF